MKFRIKETVEHQNIGGKIITIDEKISKELTDEQVYMEGGFGNIACYNFAKRRPDFVECFMVEGPNLKFPHKLYYGKVGNLGYIVASDELEEVEDNESL